MRSKFLEDCCISYILFIQFITPATVLGFEPDVALGVDVSTEPGIIIGAAVGETLDAVLGFEPDVALGVDVSTEPGIIVGAAVGETLDAVLRFETGVA